MSELRLFSEGHNGCWGQGLEPGVLVCSFLSTCSQQKLLQTQLALCLCFSFPAAVAKPCEFKLWWPARGPITCLSVKWTAVGTRGVFRNVCAGMRLCVCVHVPQQRPLPGSESEGEKENLKNRKPAFPPQRKKKKHTKKDSRRAHAEASEPGRGSLDNTHNSK